MFNQKKTLEAATKVANNTNIIGRDTTIQGNIEAIVACALEGSIQGNIRTQSKLVLAEGAFLKGNVLAKNVEIAGTTEGKIEVTDTLVLRAKARVKGNIHTRKLIVEVGAQLNGQCHMHTQDNDLPIPTKQINKLLEKELPQEA